MIIFKVILCSIRVHTIENSLRIVFYHNEVKKDLKTRKSLNTKRFQARAVYVRERFVIFRKQNLLWNFVMYIINMKSYDFSRSIWNKHPLVSFSKSSNCTRPGGLVQFWYFLKDSLVQIKSKLNSKLYYYLYITNHIIVP